MLSTLSKLALLFFILQTASKRSPLLRYVLRTLGLVASIAIAGVLACLASLILVPLQQRFYVNAINAYFFRLFCPLFTGIQAEIVSGHDYLEHTPGKPCIYVANHQSTLDLMVISTVWPSRTVISGKKEIKYIPIMGQVLWAGSNIFIDRQNRKNAIDAMTQVGNRMKKDDLNFFIFPEGTRSHQIDNTLLPFKKGAFHLAKQFGYPIVPIVSSTYYPAYDEKRKLFNDATIQVKGTTIHLIPVLPPIDSTDESKSVNDLVKETHDAMSQALKDIKTVCHGKKKIQ
ncbi:hypothetical protein BC833DRAFT_625172 [Globomyces pollinis-pini]|nr:hypothetical protein BC833DRAFT_625172 [Globomyces pollinis-pini]KAJ2993182.1 1-acylglycerol-3-phosphate O-acyltransferase [Globomyces sp. JEL0801]